MDIALNIVKSECNTKKNNTEKKNQFVSKNVADSNEAKIFSFRFANNNKVKALVAKRKKLFNNTGPNVSLKKYGSREPKSALGNVSCAQGDISLNIDIRQGINSNLLKNKKQTSTRECLKRKDYEKSINEVKVLTQEEIEEGIKKFSHTVKIKDNNKRKNGIPSDKNRRSTGLFKNIPETKIIGQRLVKPVVEEIFTGVAIESLGLHPHCIKNLSDILNITHLTTVQQKAIPKALEGRDLLIRSQTGSGKTLAYALPVIQKLQEIRPKLCRESGIQAVVIVPTRELAIQTYELFLKLLKPYTWIVPGIFMGGEKRKSEKARLRKGINILIGTPGRLCDHLIHTETFKLDKSKFLILDEADKLLELGYERDVKKVVEAIKEHKWKHQSITLGLNPFKKGQEEMVSGITSDVQRLLLSATLTPSVEKLAGLTLKNPLFIDTSELDNTKCTAENQNYNDAVQQAVLDEKLVIPATVKLSYIIIPPKLRLVTLCGVLSKEQQRGKLKALIFMSTMEMVNFHYSLMLECLTHKVLDEEEDMDTDSDNATETLLHGVSIFKLHGSMTQQERSGVFKAFQCCKSGVMIATDVVGRGIDIAEVNLVVQYSPPQQIAEFVHRVGRTARAGKSGQAILFLTPTEIEFIKNLEDKRIRISQGNMEEYLNVLVHADLNAKNGHEAASNLQHKFELLIKDDAEMYESACRAFMSWVRSYSTFSRELKDIFNIKTAHMGHYAKSFGLSDPPKSFAKRHSLPKPITPTNRLTFNKRDIDNGSQHNKNNKRKSTNISTDKINKLVKKSSILLTSEFDSGLQVNKKRKKH